ncbi:MAG: hypothetical protein ABI480_12750 [Chitinophagaceae bacterium]
MKQFILSVSALLITMCSIAQTKAGDYTAQFVPSTIGPYCPKKLLGGDREFGGHGPEIWSWVKLRISGNTIVADVYMHARETVSDWSETEGNWSKIIYTAPAGYQIASIGSGQYSEVHYISKPGVNAFSPTGLLTAIGGQKGTDVPFKDDGLVARWNIVGDTGGDDISTDDNPNDDTQVAIQLNPMKVKLTKIPANNSSTTGAAAPKTMAIVSPRIVTTLLINKDSTVQYVPSTVGPYCPNKLLGGDREFGGHGPEIWAWTKIVIRGRDVYATVYMHARETVSDWSETEGTWSKLLYTAPAGYEVIDVLSGKYSEVHYISRPGVNAFSPTGLLTALGGQHGTDVPFKDDGLVTRWNIVGDTGGTDISDDTNCNDDTQVAVQLNPMKIKIRKVN